MRIAPDMPPSRYDLHFMVLGIPVRVQASFWAVALLMGIGGRPELAEIALWVLVVFLSILLHELGHALTAASYGWPASITLHAFGGYASYLPTHRTRFSELLIAAAGPGAEFVMAAALVAGLTVAGLEAPFLGWNLGGIGLIDNSHLRLLVYYLLYVNIFWGLVNLLPIYPLDGSRIAREILAFANPQQAAQQSLWLSVITGVGMAAVSVKYMESLNSPVLVFFFGYLAFLSYQALAQGAGR